MITLMFDYVIDVLPIGSIAAFRLVVSNFKPNEVCDSAVRNLTLLLIFLLHAIPCFLASFTDSIKSSDGQVYYGIATFNKMLLSSYPDSTASNLPDLRKYRIRFADLVRAILSLFVFASAALNHETVGSFCPKYVTERIILDIACTQAKIGFICSLLLVLIPTRK
ncbi:hypothetical protein REPUB_Repub04eG0012300 [Reevesia pubescens]